MRTTPTNPADSPPTGTPPPGAPPRPAATGARILRCTVADPARFVTLVASPAWLGSARVLKASPGAAVYAGAIDTLPVVVKCLRLDRPKDLLARALGRTRGLRQWQGAGLLSSAGFATPELLVLARGRGPDGHTVETLVMERVLGPTLLEVIAGRSTLSGGDTRALARAGGELVAAMSRAGVRNRDLKPSNLIVAPSPNPLRGHTPWTLVQIDTVGVNRAPDADRAEMLFRLLVECVGTGHTPTRGLRWRAALAAADNEPARARALWRAAERRLARHGDPTPKDNPLSPA